MRIRTSVVISTKARRNSGPEIPGKDPEIGSDKVKNYFSEICLNPVLSLFWVPGQNWASWDRRTLKNWHKHKRGNLYFQGGKTQVELLAFIVWKSIIAYLNRLKIDTTCLRKCISHHFLMMDVSRFHSTNFQSFFMTFDHRKTFLSCVGLSPGWWMCTDLAEIYPNTQ